MLMLLSAFIISLSLVSGQWGDKIERERVNSLRRGQGTYNPKSAWMFVDSRRRVLPDIDGRVLYYKFYLMGSYESGNPSAPLCI